MRFFRKVLTKINSASSRGEGMLAVFKVLLAFFSQVAIFMLLIILHISRIEKGNMLAKFEKSVKNIDKSREIVL